MSRMRKGQCLEWQNRLSETRDIVGEGYIKDIDGKIVTDADKLLEVWRAYCDKLSNVEFPWNKDTLTEVGI